MRSDVISDIYDSNISDQLWNDMYHSIETHPNFAPAVALLETLEPFSATVANEYGAYFSMTTEMTQTLMENFLNVEFNDDP